jgi:hypothetical protein
LRCLPDPRRRVRNDAYDADNTYDRYRDTQGATAGRTGDDVAGHGAGQTGLKNRSRTITEKNENINAIGGGVIAAVSDRLPVRIQAHAVICLTGCSKSQSKSVEGPVLHISYTGWMKTERIRDDRLEPKLRTSSTKIVGEK